jgi:hypothetical protein
MSSHLNARTVCRRFHTMMLESRLLEASCFIAGLNARAVTACRCPRKWRSNVGSSPDISINTNIKIRPNTDLIHKTFNIHEMSKLVSCQNYWVYGIWPSSGVLNTRKNNVLETGLRLALSKGHNRVGVPLSSPEDGKRSTFRNVVFSSI